MKLWEKSMTVIETWKGIADKLRRSERWCRYMAKNEVDPLPVFKVGGIVRLEAEDLKNWLSRQKRYSHMDSGAFFWT